MNVGEVEGVVKKKMQQLGWNYPTLLDTRSQVSRLFGTTGHPEAFLIDKEGRIAAVAIGPRDWTDATAGRFIDELIAEPSAAGKEPNPNS